MDYPRILAARRAAEIEPFQVMDVLARAQALEAAGRRVIHMEIGEPDFTAPEAVVEAGVRSLRGGLTAYTAALGLNALREAIATWTARQFGRSLDASRVAITPGASGGLLLALALYATRSSSARSISVPVGFDGEPSTRPLVRGPQAARTSSSVGWKADRGETASARATPSKARTKCR